MRKPKAYLDTTIPNYLFNDHTPDKQKSTRELYQMIEAQKYIPHISDIVLGEIGNTPDKSLRDKLMNAVSNFTILDATQECKDLALEYISYNIVTQESANDVLHIAIASIFEMDFLISYNFEHIVKVKTIDMITAVNLIKGYKTPRIVIPDEVLDV